MPSLPDGMRRRCLRAEERTRPGGPADWPPVLEPASPSASAPALAALLARQSATLRALLAAEGALLFRGWGVDSPEALGQVLESAGFRLSDHYRHGTSPRAKAAPCIFESTTVSDGYPILAHNEMSYLSRRPGFIAFACAEAPPRDGETPIFDCRAAARNLPPALADWLRQRQVRYRRLIRRGGLLPVNAVFRTWREVFGTASPEAIRQLLEEAGVTGRFRGRLLVTDVRVDPLPLHPVGGEPCLAVQLFHPAGVRLDMAELTGRQHRLLRAWRTLLLRLLYGSHLSPLQIRLGDGAPLPDELVLRLRQAYWDNAVLFRWRRGDLLLLDNLAVAHGRMNVVRPRRILAAFGEPVTLPLPPLEPAGALRSPPTSAAGWNRP